MGPSWGFLGPLGSILARRRPQDRKISENSRSGFPSWKPRWKLKSIQNGSGGFPKSINFLDWLWGRVSVAFGPNLVPTWSPKPSQNRAKLVAKFIKNCIKMLTKIGSEVAGQTQRFLAQLRLRTCEPEQRGTTWLELYTLYKIQGNPCAIGDPGGKAEPRPAVRKQNMTFRNAVRAIASNTMEQEQEKLIKPSRFKGFALKRLGIEMYLPMIGAKVAMNRQERRRVDEEILRLRGIKAKDVQEVLSGRKRIPCSKISLKSKATWSKSIRTVKTADEEEEVDEQESAVNGKIAGMRVQSMEQLAGASFTCTKCGQKTSARRIGFDLENLSAQVACGGCKKKAAAKEWNCSCGIRWHQCKQHASAPSILRSGVLVRKRTQRKALVQSKHFLESRLADLDGLQPQKRVMLQKVAQEARAEAYSAQMLRIAMKVCSRGNLKRKFGHISEPGKAGNT